MGNSNNSLSNSEFNDDSSVLGQQTDRFLRLIYPSYLIDNSSINNYIENDSSSLLDSMTFFRISSCTIENTEDIFESVNQKFEKLFTALHSINIPIGYGIISRNGITNLVLGVYKSADIKTIKSIINGILFGIEMKDYNLNFSECNAPTTSYGILSGIPTVFLKEKKQKFTPSTIMKTLNGQDYTLLFLAKPVNIEMVKQDIGELINLSDITYSISKRNIARNLTKTNSDTHGDTKTTSMGGFFGLFIPPFTGGISSSISTGYSDSITNAISEGKTIASDIQNGFALQLINYATKSIERLKEGQSNGMWETAICYSADTELSRNIIKACLYSELSKSDLDKLPLRSFDLDGNNFRSQRLLIPSFLNKNINKQNPLCSYINTSELGLLCTLPTENVPDFELRTAKFFPLVKSTNSLVSNKNIGYITDGKRKLNNMPFGLSVNDLNKHTFVCGITGSGKTTTVKRILIEADKPFLVIESAKKEYRNIPLKTIIYTLGKPEINCPKINPFYIMPGVNPQMHIDYLKDLFTASFSFYGPMPYILEQCLHNIYINKGWNLTLGYHPLLNNTKNYVDFFDINYIEKQYLKMGHRYLFPTMQDLKDEIERYIEKEMDYEGEVASNIKTAIKIRLENLCVGSKGYMFNTYEYIDLKKLLEEKVIFELEGLADDSDKAFCVGLMIIFINEYKQIVKETYGSKKMELSHLLVIEEAHRLLKNINTERSTENIGNPKGKAVEHFTNMIAEMRSYGQGVIIAEQIPTKLAPEVIKNSSNKIVHRLVSIDDQEIIANTIGLSSKDALQLGILQTGYALSHKEGMSLPVSIKLDDVQDDFVSDELLFNRDLKERLNDIDLISIREVFSSKLEVKEDILTLLNTIALESDEIAIISCKIIIKKFMNFIQQNGVEQILSNNIDKKIAIIISDLLANFLIKGVYSIKELPNDKFFESLNEFLIAPTSDTFRVIKQNLSELYNGNLQKIFLKIITELIKRDFRPDIDIKASIKKYFVKVSDKTVNEIFDIIKEMI